MKNQGSVVDWMIIKFANGSIIRTIDSDTVYMPARGNGKSRMVLKMLINSLELKWYQRLWLKIRWKI